MAGAVWLGNERGLDERSCKPSNSFGLEAIDPFGDGLWRCVELARHSGFGQPAVHHSADHHLSTSRGQRRILVCVHSVLHESLTFGDISVRDPIRMDNLLKAHS